MMRRPTAALGAVATYVLAAPSDSLAHGLTGRADLPIPAWLFGWAAALVLVISFVVLGTLWPRPKFARDSWRALPHGIGTGLGSRPVQVVCGLVGVALLALVVWAGLAGTKAVQKNFAPTFVYVIFWVGLVPVSVMFGDVFRALNPWRAVGYVFAKGLSAIAGEPMRAPFAYPKWLGRWPAAATIFAFAWMELIASSGSTPRSVAIGALIYSAVTFGGMAAFGIKPWLDRGEGFSVYFNLFSRISVFEYREGTIGVRPPLAGLPALSMMPGTVPMLAMMIGTVTFDGATEGALISSIVPKLRTVGESLGLGFTGASELALAISMVATIAVIFGFYRLGILGARSVGGGYSANRLANEFVHTLVPIALVYVGAHYLTYLLFQGQAIFYLISDPLGDGSNLLGTAGGKIDYSLIGATTTWYLQVGLVICGHVAALMLAHDRALVLYRDTRQAIRSQYWMLAIMIGFTSLALWLLSQANA